MAHFHAFMLDGRARNAFRVVPVTLKDFRRIRREEPGRPRFCIAARDLAAADEMAGLLFNTGFHRSEWRGNVPVIVETWPSEIIDLGDGPADQSLIPGVAPVASAVRQLEAERKRRDTRHGHAPLPCGGLWDETAQRQRSLF